MLQVGFVLNRRESNTIECDVLFRQNFVFRIVLARSSIEFDVSNSHFAALHLGKSFAKVKVIISRVNLVLESRSRNIVVDFLLGIVANNLTIVLPRDTSIILIKYQTILCKIFCFDWKINSNLF